MNLFKKKEDTGYLHCPYCKQTIGDKERLKIHLNEMHGENKLSRKERLKRIIGIGDKKFHV